jgi:DNA-binding MarR family transcriptional regulator
LTGLLEELMGMIALQYLGSRAARREQQRPAPALRKAPKARWEVSAHRERDPLDEVDMRLTYRTARVLEGARENPGASNRQIADRAGITDPGQVSKLLRRLERLGLLENEGLGHAQGEPNKWKLTPLGCQIAQRLSVVALNRVEAA